jgi:UDP-galactopyranose mutase
MIDGALRPVRKPMGPNARFGYPLRGGFQSLMDGFLPLLKGELRLNAQISSVVPSKHQVMLENGEIYVYEKLVSTMPLPMLIACMGDEVPDRVRAAAERLRHVSVRCVNLGIARQNITDKHWIYYPEDSVFHRIFVQGNASPNNNAPGGCALTCEISYSPHKPLPCEGDALIDRCIADCIAVGILTPEDQIVARNQVDMPYAYVVYDHARAENVELIRRWLAARDIELAGRYSEWEYYNSDHAFLAGRKAAQRVKESLARPASETPPRALMKVARPGVAPTLA